VVLLLSSLLDLLFDVSQSCLFDVRLWLLRSLLLVLLRSVFQAVVINVGGRLDVFEKLVLHEVFLTLKFLTLGWLVRLVVVVLVTVLVFPLSELLLDQDASVLFTKLDLHILEVSPFLKNLHSLDVLDGSQLFSVVFVATKRVKVDLLTEVLVFVLDELHDVDYLLTAKDLVIVHTSDGVEDCPHDLRVVDSSVMVSDIETEDDLVES
jgi:hypothetical protein